MPRAVRYSGWLLLFGVGVFLCGTGMSVDVLSGLPFGLFLLMVLFAAAAISHLAVFTLPRWLRERRKDGTHCAHCGYTVPAAGTQLCPECGATTTERERRPTTAASDEFKLWLAKSAFVCFCALPVAGVLTGAEFLTTWYFGRRAFRNYEALTFSAVPSSHWNDGWVIPAYTGARVPGGWLYEDSEVPGIRPAIFRPTRWTPWPHAADLFYDEDERGRGRVFYYLD